MALAHRLFALRARHPFGQARARLRGGGDSSSTSKQPIVSTPSRGPAKQGRPLYKRWSYELRNGLGRSRASSSRPRGSSSQGHDALHPALR